MNIKQVIPKAPDILREAIIVMAGALLASIVVRGLPPSLSKYFSWPGSSE
ncbi:MAG TPA: hypothetical protein VJ673_02675 [Aromatoleum sp.]|nr:hypothetical protein [Aromatoleum sp.]HJV24557.1 hypothetical protein [Aromatoleum sp.]